MFFVVLKCWLSIRVKFKRLCSSILKVNDYPCHLTLLYRLLKPCNNIFYLAKTPLYADICVVQTSARLRQWVLSWAIWSTMLLLTMSNCFYSIQQTRLMSDFKLAQIWKLFLDVSTYILINIFNFFISIFILGFFLIYEWIIIILFFIQSLFTATVSELMYFLICKSSLHYTITYIHVL